jgi:hypothetical protein
MKNIQLSFFLAFLFLTTSFLKAQETDKKVIRKIFDQALTKGDCYENLRELCKDIGGRLSGSPEAEKAVQWAKMLLETMDLDRVYLQEVMVPHWVRGEKEVAEVRMSNGESQEVAVCALGGSIATPNEGITAEVIEVFGLDELENIGAEKIKDKIVFYNRPMEPRLINTFHAYGGCVDQRSSGASQAAPFGARAVIVRSMNLRDDDHPHTGVQRYLEGVEKIPAAAISTNHAEMLSKALKLDPKLKFHLKMNCESLPDATSHNVIAEIKGSKYPNEIILVGGHLDSWDTGEGAHDDGAGVVQSIEVLNLFKSMGMKPERTIRCVLFMNEENGARGAEDYANMVKENGEHHIAAIESDRGGFSPRGFTVDGQDGVKEACMELLLGWAKLLKPFDLHYFEYGYSGVDIVKLKDQGVALMGFVPDSQRYFDYHHAPNDTFEAINKRELELGAASMTALVYLLSKYGAGEGL